MKSAITKHIKQTVDKAANISERKFTPYAITLILTITLFATNYIPGAYLTGWDNLHPELNFSTNIKRSLVGVWQEYQGLGLLGGMGHSTDIVRQTILYTLSIFIPNSLLRYLWTFAMLFAGGSGAYKLIHHIINSQAAPRHNTPSQVRTIATTGALFYTLNLATIQNFYLPFEAFITHFATLPWLIFAAILYWQKPSQKNMLFFTTISLLGLTSFYIPTIFLVTLTALSITLGTLTILKPSTQATANMLKLGTATLIINAFWLLPFTYFTITNPSVVSEAKINQMASRTTFLQNKEFGNITNVAQLKGYWFGVLDFNLRQEYTYILEPWINHLDQAPIKTIGYLLLVPIAAGIAYTIYKRDKLTVPIGCLLTLSLFALAIDTPTISHANAIIRSALPILDEALRSPFTKFSTLLSLTLAIMFSLGILKTAKLLKLKRGIILATCATLSVLIAIYALPAFQGKMFFERQQVKFPPQYRELQQFFKTQNKNTRIANFPQNTFWGWNLYRWGYNGAGFLWYALEQPILDRAFDPWSRANENYYWEISYALYKQDLKILENTLEKYQVTWLLVDGYKINPDSPKSLYTDELAELVSKSNKIKLAKTFGKIKVYKVNLDTQIQNFVYTIDKTTNIEPTYKWNNYDQAFQENGHYISYKKILPTVYYPFRSLFTGKNQNNIEFKISESKESYIFESDLPTKLKTYSLEIPNTGKELLWIDENDLSRTSKLTPKVNRSKNSIQISTPKIKGYLGAEINPGKQNECIKETETQNLVQLNSKKETCSMSYWLPNLTHNASYVITVESRNVAGTSLEIWIENLNSRRGDLYTNLPTKDNITTSYFIQPPMEKYGLGYSLHFDNKPIGNQESINELGQTTVNQIPYKFLTQLSLRKDKRTNNTQTSTRISTKHPTPSTYIVNVAKKNEQQTLTLSQAFDKGWQAYQLNGKWQLQSEKLAQILAPLFGKRLQNHVLVNNWANGWILEPSNQDQQIVILLLPQYLQYVGFLLLLTIPILIKYSQKLV